MTLDGLFVTPERTSDTERLDRVERMLLILTRDYVDQFSGEAEAELRRMVDELREEHAHRSGAYLILDDVTG